MILARHEVRYVLIGALGARLHGSPDLTEDADITPELKKQNLGRLAAALKQMNAKLRVPGLDYGVDFPLDESSFDQGSTWTFTTDYGPVDVVLYPDGTGGFADLSRNAVAYKVFNVEVNVASLSDIIRSKEAANRPKDREAVKKLREIQARSNP